MKRHLAVLTVAVWMALPTFSQTPGGSLAKPGCSLAPAHSPEIRGIRLGMSAEQLLATFPEEANRKNIMRAVEESRQTNRYGVSRFDLRPDSVAANANLRGVDYITIEILDERVTSFHVAYTGPEWKTVDQFVAKLSEAFRIPGVEAWEPGVERTKSLKCDGFTINACAYNGVGGNSVSVRSTSTQKIVVERREASKEKERRAFKP